MSHRSLLAAAFTAAALAPLAASAAGEYHFAPTEAGVTRGAPWPAPRAT